MINCYKYSDKCVCMTGDPTRLLNQQLKNLLGGKYNSKLKDEKTGNIYSGWIFSVKRYPDILEYLDKVCILSLEENNIDKEIIEKKMAVYVLNYILAMKSGKAGDIEPFDIDMESLNTEVYPAVLSRAAEWWNDRNKIIT